MPSQTRTEYDNVSNAYDFLKTALNALGCAMGFDTQWDGKIEQHMCAVEEIKADMGRWINSIDAEGGPEAVENEMAAEAAAEFRRD